MCVVIRATACVVLTIQGTSRLQKLEGLKVTAPAQYRVYVAQKPVILQLPIMNSIYQTQRIVLLFFLWSEFLSLRWGATVIHLK